MKERFRIYDNLKKENQYLLKLKGETNEENLKLNENNQQREESLNINEKINQVKENIKIKKDYLNFIIEKNKIQQNKIKSIESKCKLINENKK